MDMAPSQFFWRLKRNHRKGKDRPPCEENLPIAAASAI
jgi:hypothetical protein